MTLIFGFAFQTLCAIFFLNKSRLVSLESLAELWNISFWQFLTAAIIFSFQFYFSNDNGSSTIEPDDLPKQINLDLKQLDLSGVTMNTLLAEKAAQATAKAEQDAINQALLKKGDNRE